MNQEQFLKILVSIGLSINEAKIYLYVASRNRIDAEDIAEGLNFSRKTIASSLSNLKKQNILITKTYCVEFYTVCPIDTLIKEHERVIRKKVFNLRKNRKLVIDFWEKTVPHST